MPIDAVGVGGGLPSAINSNASEVKSVMSTVFNISHSLSSRRGDYEVITHAGSGQMR